MLQVMQCLSHVPSLFWNNYCHFLPAARATVLCWPWELGGDGADWGLELLCIILILTISPLSLWWFAEQSSSLSLRSVVCCLGTDRQTAIRFVLKDGVGVWLLSTNKSPACWKKRLGSFLSIEGIRCYLFLKNLLFMDQTHIRSWVLCWASTRDTWEMEPGEPHGHLWNSEQEALPMATLCVPSSAVNQRQLWHRRENDDEDSVAIRKLINYFIVLHYIHFI